MIEKIARKQKFYSEGCHLYADKIQGLAKSNELISEVRGVCAECDVVISLPGLGCGPGRRRGDQGNQPDSLPYPTENPWG